MRRLGFYGPYPTPIRLSPAQMFLIAEICARVATRDMLRGMSPLDARVEPLESEFADLFRADRHLTGRMARIAIPGIYAKPWDASRRNLVCKHLLRTSMLPSTVALAVADYLQAMTGIPAGLHLEQRTSLRLHPHGAASVSRKFGVPQEFVPLCWTMAAELDAAWHRCRAELATMRSEPARGVQA